MSRIDPDSGSASRGLGVATIIGLAAIAGSAVLHAGGSRAFEPYYGAWNPVVVTSLVAVAALVSLRLLEEGGWLFVDRPAEGRGRFVHPIAWAAALSIPVTLVDLAGGFPEGINVAPPEALLFYPTIAVVAETVFHVAPMAVLIVIAARLFSAANPTRVLVTCLAIVALPEPILQVAWGVGESPGWANAYVAAHLLFFNLLAVYLFRRHGFLSMLTLRLTYYAWWHLVWGALRLRIIPWG